MITLSRKSLLFKSFTGLEDYSKKDSDKAEIFHKVEPYLTFLNIPQLGIQGQRTRDGKSIAKER